MQAALAKTTKVLLNLKQMTSDEISEHMKVSFFDYEAWCNKRKVEGFKSVWKKNYIPRLSSKFWHNTFTYMLHKESVYEDVELFIAYPSKDCIRDYWNMAETYAAKVSRKLLYGPIGFKKRIFLRTDILDNHLKSTHGLNRCHRRPAQGLPFNREEMEIFRETKGCKTDGRRNVPSRLLL